MPGDFSTFKTVVYELVYDFFESVSQKIAVACESFL
jgi:hypothetical protein